MKPTHIRAALAVICLVAALQAGGASQSESQTDLAQKLGMPGGTRLVMIHADDAGITHSVNLAIERAFESHSLSSASIIVPSPWFPEIAAFAKAHPEYDFGVHLALNAEWRYLRWGGVSPADKIPSLLDPQGFLWDSAEAAAAHIRPEEARLELRAQIDRALSFGVPVSHLDTHMLTLLSSPELAKIYADLSREYHLPILIWREAQDPWAKALADTAPSRFVKPFMVGRAFPGPRGPVDQFADMYKKAVLEAQPNEVAELVVHPAIQNDELVAAIGDGSYGSSWRDTDYHIISSPEMHAFLEQNHARLVTWKQLTATGLIEGAGSKNR